MTFLQWLRLQVKRDDRVGDFARDSVAKRFHFEPPFPIRVRRKSVMVEYLKNGFNSPPVVIESMCQAFDEWGEGIDDVPTNDVMKNENEDDNQ